MMKATMMLPSIVALGAVLAVLLAGSASGVSVQTVLWQFQREDGHVLSGEALEDDLGPITIEQGTVLRFKWEPYGFAHGLFQADTEADFNNCDLNGQLLVDRSTSGDYNVTLDAGTFYFIGAERSNCDTGLKVRVTVLPQGETVPPTIMTTTPVPAVDSALAKVVVVDWTYDVPKEDVEATQDDIVQFRWSGSVSSSIRRVSKEAYQACDFGDPLEIVSEATPTGVVNVTNLDVGQHYFISAEITHCSSAHMSVAVNIVPRLVRYWITIWPSDDSADVESDVSLTLTGFDDSGRVWRSPRTVVNRATSGSGDDISLSIPSAEARTFEMVARDVGRPIAVRMSSDAGIGFAPSRVRVRVHGDDIPEGQRRESKTFTCTRPEGGDMEGTAAVVCIEPSDSSAATTSAPPTNQTQERDCQCFRQLLAHHPSQRVLACSKEGCFATVDDGTAGWSSVPAIASLIGTAMDGRLLAAGSHNTTLASIDGGLTWRAIDLSTAPPITSAAVAFSDPLFEGDGSEPLDRHVQPSASNSVDWGITRKGVLVNMAGVWEFRALWSCTCDGTCGLECNQPLW